MSRKRFVAVPGGGWAEVGADYIPPSRTGTMIMPDIKPYQAMATDIATGTAPVIKSRSEHRDYLRRNGYIEIGNEKPKGRTEIRGDFNVRRELTQAAREAFRKG